MGTTLTGTQINNTYDGLIKTTDNTAITATTKLISDGLGNDSCIKVGTAGTDFLGAVDFSAATVTGLPGGAAGLVSGTGTDSMISDSSLTTLPATGAGNCSISLGNDAQAPQQFDISIGHATRGGGQYGVALGHTASTAGAGFGIAVGCGAQSTGGGQNIAIGKNARAQTLSQNIAIGQDALSQGNGGAISIGCNARQTGLFNGVAAIGKDAQVSATAAQAFGWSASATAQNAVAIGCNLTASTANTVSVCALETQTASTPTAGGIIMSDAGGTDRRINIDATGGLQIDSTPVGGGGSHEDLTTTSRALNPSVEPVGDPEYYFRMTYLTTNATTQNLLVAGGTANITAMSITEGSVIDNFLFSVGTAATTPGDVARVFIYKSAEDADGNIVLGDLELDCGTVVTDTTGNKIITGLNHTLGSTVANTYWLGVWNNSAGSIDIKATQYTNLGGGQTHGNITSGFVYRGNQYLSPGHTSGSLPTNGMTWSWTYQIQFPLFGISR